MNQTNLARMENAVLLNIPVYSFSFRFPIFYEKSYSMNYPPQVIIDLFFYFCSQKLSTACLEVLVPTLGPCYRFKTLQHGFTSPTTRACQVWCSHSKHSQSTIRDTFFSFFFWSIFECLQGHIILYWDCQNFWLLMLCHTVSFQSSL